MEFGHLEREQTHLGDNTNQETKQDTQSNKTNQQTNKTHPKKQANKQTSKQTKQNKTKQNKETKKQHSSALITAKGFFGNLSIDSTSTALIFPPCFSLFFVAVWFCCLTSRGSSTIPPPSLSKSLKKVQASHMSLGNAAISAFVG